MINLDYRLTKEMIEEMIEIAGEIDKMKFQGKTIAEAAEYVNSTDASSAVKKVAITSVIPGLFRESIQEGIKS